MKLPADQVARLIAAGDGARPNTPAYRWLHGGFKGATDDSVQALSKLTGVEPATIRYLSTFDLEKMRSHPEIAEALRKLARQPPSHGPRPEGTTLKVAGKNVKPLPTSTLIETSSGWRLSFVGLPTSTYEGTQERRAAAVEVGLPQLEPPESKFDLTRAELVERASSAPTAIQARLKKWKAGQLDLGGQLERIYEVALHRALPKANRELTGEDLQSAEQAQVVLARHVSSEAGSLIAGLEFPTSTVSSDDQLKKFVIAAFMLGTHDQLGPAGHPASPDQLKALLSPFGAENAWAVNEGKAVEASPRPAGRKPATVKAPDNISIAHETGPRRR